MKTTLIACTVALAAMMTPTAYAQGEVGAVPKAEPRAKRTQEQRAAGKALRRVDGRDGARAGTPGELGPVAKTSPKAQYTKEDRSAARATRKAATAKANKAGELPVAGEVGPKS